MYSDFSKLREKLQDCWYELTKLVNCVERVQPGNYSECDLTKLKINLQEFADRLREDCGIEGEFVFQDK